MFKKTEETEWTRFSKALSSRDQDQAEETAEVKTSPPPAAVSPSPATRQPAPDVGTSPRPAGRATPPPAVEEDVESTIGQHTTIDGTFKSETSIRIRGSVKGDVESRRSILVEEQANVDANVTAESVTVAGKVSGHIYCSGRVEIQPTGRVTGEINAGTLVMQEGAFFEGNLKMGERSSQVVQPETEKIGAKR